ncbi:amino acid permease-domain-containing protein [Mycena rosella]|uniref:Amino acid permease-domain-containing protein n=1 Tax=Mycena rosella TaxID=1033263 RepID=A0AAD7GFB4_MYCRO|nr:amino acid permease-domain-containing protein [Mycena rosella]
MASEKPSEKPAAEEFVHNESLDQDTESGRQKDDLDAAPGEHKLVRQLKNRHIAMISIGGVIGTGLFLSTANSLRQGGPVFSLVTLRWKHNLSVMISLGEMIAYLPIPGGHIKLAERFVDPAFSFTMGWNYWYNWTIILPAELSASAVLIGFWNKDVNPAAWITIVMVVVIGINMCGAGVYGEADSIKVITGSYWTWEEVLIMTELGFATGNTLAPLFSGTEIVALQEKQRILGVIFQRPLGVFISGGVIIIGLLVPSTDPGLNLTTEDAASSPFVIAIKRSGIKALPSIINACLLTSAWSAVRVIYTQARGHSTGKQSPFSVLKLSCYARHLTSRTGNFPGSAAWSGAAPRRWHDACSCGKCPPNLHEGPPQWSSDRLYNIFSTLAYMSVTSGSGKVFGWFSNMTSVAGLMTWFGICLTYIRFYEGMKAQGYDRKHLPFASPLQPFAAWYGMIFCIVICFFSGWATLLKGHWDTATFVTNYLPFALFPVLDIAQIEADT